MLWQEIDLLENLISVQKPARYIGEEWNLVKKDWSRTKIKILLSYPDIYEIGMSNLGLAILYQLLNSSPQVLCERCFAPWPDMEGLLRKKNQPLYSLESKTPINKFDLIGFTLQHELNYSNVLTILELGRIKLWQAERSNFDPLVVGGGPSTLNPEPVADFFDFFILGDGEEVIWPILERLKAWKEKKISRGRFLELISEIECVYVPSLFKTRVSREGFLIPLLERKVKKAVIENLDKVSYPSSPIVPYIQTVHDRINLEIMRGCFRSCRFCQAKVYYGPARVRSVKNLLAIAQAAYRSTGQEEICLSSLSSGDYPYLLELLQGLRKVFQDKYLFITLPSLWAGERINEILNFFLEAKRPALTFAPEVASLRMKETIGKFVSEEKIIQIVKFALNRGWKAVKLYYMLGLPGMSEKDLDEMREFLLKLTSLKVRRRVVPRISFATFIPKPHTPLQWMKFIPPHTFSHQIEYVKRKLSKLGIKWEARPYQYSLLEAVLSRGDRRLSKVIHQAWLNGARFDSWERNFNFGLWESALQKYGLDPAIYLETELDRDSALPWEHIDPGMSKEELWKSYSLARAKIRGEV